MLDEQTYRDMAEWLVQMHGKLVAYADDLATKMTAENEIWTWEQLQQQKAKLSCMTWLIGLANQAAERREIARIRQEGGQAALRVVKPRKKGD